jgi:hypothetical protein
MNTNLHIKPGSTINIETYDLYENDSLDYTQIIKIKGFDDNGGKFEFTLFGSEGLQSPISIETLDNTEVKVNGTRATRLSVKEEIKDVE